MIKVLLKDTAILTAVNVVTKAIGLLMFPIYARYLSIGEYGVYDYLVLVGTVGTIIVGLETYQGILRLISTKETLADKRRLFSSSILYILVFGGIVTLIITVLAYASSGYRFGLQCPPEIVAAAAVSWVVIAVQNQLVALQRALLKVKVIAIAGLASAICQISVGILAVTVFGLGSLGLVLAALAGALGAVTVLLYQSKDFVCFTFSFEALREVVGYSAPLVISSLAAVGWIYLDRYIAKLVLGVEAVGYLGIGYRFAGLATLVTGAIGMALSPLIYKTHENKDTANELTRIFRFYVLFSLICITAFAGYSRLVLSTLRVPESYWPAAEVMPQIAAAILIGAGYQFFPGLAIARKTSLIALIQVLGLILNVFLSLWLVVSYGINGVTIASVLTATMVFIANGVLGQRFYPIQCQWGKVLIAGAGVACLVVLLHVYHETSVVVRRLGLIAPFFVAIISITLGLVRFQELRAAISRLKLPKLA